MKKIKFCLSQEYSRKPLYYMLGTSDQFKDNGFGHEYVLASEAEAEIEALRDVNGEMDSMYQDRLLDMEAKVADSAERERVLVEALEEAIGAGEYVIRLCENDLACGASPNPMVKSMPHATLAECYAAMRFLTKARAALAAKEG